MNPYQKKFDRKIALLIFLLAVAKVMLHLYTNAFAGYGPFRDEMYYLACADRLDLGYVDHPPLSIWLLALIKAVFGDSIFAVRFFPAVFAGVSLFFIALTTRELGGNKIAIVVVSLCMMFSGINLSFAAFYSMNAIDLLLWAVIIFLLVRMVKTQKKRYWIYLGFALGLALLNKIGALFLGTGIFVALVATPQRKWLKTRWPYITASISFLLFTPYIIWNIMHDWAHLEFINNASSMKYGGLNPLDFWAGQLLINNPVTIPVWLLAVVFFFIKKKKTGYNFIFIIFATVAFILTINGTSKPEYLAAIFPVLFIGGALFTGHLPKNKSWAQVTIIALLFSGAFLIPFAVPILPVEKYIRYADFIGIKPESAENKELSALPQFYADMFGWKEKAAAVSEAYIDLSPKMQKKSVFFGDNYGRSAAIEYYSRQYDLPQSIGNHNNYWLWGPGYGDIEVVFILSREVGDKTSVFEVVEDLGTVTCEYCMPYENNLRLYRCSGFKKLLKEIWPEKKSFI